MLGSSIFFGFSLKSIFIGFQAKDLVFSDQAILSEQLKISQLWINILRLFLHTNNQYHHEQY